MKKKKKGSYMREITSKGPRSKVNEKLTEIAGVGTVEGRRRGRRVSSSGGGGSCDSDAGDGDENGDDV
jgi:hypothetical protein